MVKYVSSLHFRMAYISIKVLRIVQYTRHTSLEVPCLRQLPKLVARAAEDEDLSNHTTILSWGTRMKRKAL